MLLDKRKIPIEVIGDFIAEYFVYTKENFKDDQTQYLTALEIFMELNRLTNNFETLNQIIQQYVNLIGKIHGFKSAQAITAYLKQA